jgi:hypothetical protein
MTIINSSDLDFNTIKNNLKTYFQQQSEFSDYNFEASGLSNILDVLAYNTHLNGLIANFSVNESFLSSSQLRSSVVSHAENLGYYPRSKSGSNILVNITVNTSDTVTSTVTLPAFSGFTADIDGTSYNFQTTESYTGINNGSGSFPILTAAGSSSIKITEGISRTKTFIVGETEDEQIYVIPDENLDTSTIVVRVFDTLTSSSSTVYSNVNNVVSINTNSTVYILREAPNGYFEITFSDGRILGKAPVAGNKIEVQYLSSSGAAANGATTFEGNYTISGVTIDSTTISLATAGSRSSGGDEKESIDSIKVNAPIKFATQQRLVTAEDYKALILSNYGSTVEDVSAWGGNDNIPPVYGQVYVSLKFKDNITAATQSSIKTSIQNNLSDALSIMSIDTVFTDPVDTFMELAVTFNFDPDLGGVNSSSIEATTRTSIVNYFNQNLNRFDSVFRRSNLLATIDELSTSILNSKMDVKIRQNAAITLNSTLDYKVSFPVQLSVSNDDSPIITSSVFTFNGNRATLRNRLVHNSNVIEIIDTDGTVLKSNTGSYNPANGQVTLTSFNISAIEDGTTSIKITALPANQSTIKPLRNHIIQLDQTKMTILANLDYQNTESAITL